MSDNTLLSQMPEITKIYQQEKSLVEIMVNADGKIWIEASGRVKDTGMKMSDSRINSIIRLLAGTYDYIVNQKNPELSAKLPVFEGGRFHALIPPVVSSAMFSVRFPPKKVLSLDDLLLNNSVTAHNLEKIYRAIENHSNIIIAGSTGSGKTTIANAIIQEIKKERLIVIEDNPEIKTSALNNVHILTNSDFSLRDSVKASLRLRPDRIIIGEIRDGGTALDLCKAWLTGHPGGIGTIHASSAKAVDSRIKNLIQEVVSKPDESLIKEAINMIIFVQKITESEKIVRKITSVFERKEDVI